MLGGQAGTSRRIENYLGFPAGISGSELTSRAVTQARKFGARTATPYRARALEPGAERHLVKLEEGNEILARTVLLSTGAEYRRLPVDDLDDYEGISVFYAAGPPEGQLCGGQRVGVIGGGNSAAQAAIWLARGGALVTLLHRRADLGETMSNYLIEELDRYGVAVRDRSEVSALHGEDGQARGGDADRRDELPFSFLFLFLGATPCTDWLGDGDRPRRQGVRPDRRRGGRRRPARDQRPRHLRRRRRARRLDQALRHRGRRGRHRRALRPRAHLRGRRRGSLQIKISRASDPAGEGAPLLGPNPFKGARNGTGCNPQTDQRRRRCPPGGRRRG